MIERVKPKYEVDADDADDVDEQRDLLEEMDEIRMRIPGRPRETIFWKGLSSILAITTLLLSIQLWREFTNRNYEHGFATDLSSFLCWPLVGRNSWLTQDFLQVPSAWRWKQYRSALLAH